MNISVTVSFTRGVINDHTSRKISRNEFQKKLVVKTFDTQRLPKTRPNENGSMQYLINKGSSRGTAKNQIYDFLGRGIL
jgi:hypothetical protein